MNKVYRIFLAFVTLLLIINMCNIAVWMFTGRGTEDGYTIAYINYWISVFNYYWFKRQVKGYA